MKAEQFVADRNGIPVLKVNAFVGNWSDVQNISVELKDSLTEFATVLLSQVDGTIDSNLVLHATNYNLVTEFVTKLILDLFQWIQERNHRDIDS